MGEIRRKFQKGLYKERDLGIKLNQNDSAMVALGEFGPKYPYYVIQLNSSRQRLIIIHLFGASSSSSMEFPPEGYRRNVGICLFNSSGKIFAASRLIRSEIWQMPQGGVNEGEDLKTAARRELIEETGVISAEIVAELPYWLTYDFSLEASIKLSQHWGVRYKGQAQKWFLLKFTGKDEEINLLGDGTERPEFGKWSWMSIEQILELVSNTYSNFTSYPATISRKSLQSFKQAANSKKPVYEQVMKEFSNLIPRNGDDANSLNYIH